MAVDPTTIRLPPPLIPEDGRFGSGPSKVRDDAVARLVQYEAEIEPNLAWSQRYEPMINLFNRIYQQSEEYWDAFSELVS